MYETTFLFQKFHQHTISFSSSITQTNKLMAWSFVKNAGVVAAGLACLVGGQELSYYATKLHIKYLSNATNYTLRKLATSTSEVEQLVVGKAAVENERGVIRIPYYRICWNDLDCVTKMNVYWKIIEKSASNIEKEVLKKPDQDFIFMD